MAPMGTCSALSTSKPTGKPANSSFINALITGLIVDHGEEVVEKLKFHGCLPTVRVLVQTAVDLGLLKADKQPL